MKISTSDHYKVKALLTELDVEFREQETLDGMKIECESGMKNVKGYSGFLVTFTFEKNGKFSSIGIWE